MLKFHSDVVRSKNVKKSHEGQERSGKVRKGQGKVREGQERSGKVRKGQEGRKGGRKEVLSRRHKDELRSKMDSSEKINKG
jgi:hypothetical protein